MSTRWLLLLLAVLVAVLVAFALTAGVAWANWQHQQLLCADALARRQAIYREWANLGGEYAEAMVGDDLTADLARYCA